MDVFRSCLADGEAMVREAAWKQFDNFGTNVDDATAALLQCLELDADLVKYNALLVLMRVARPGDKSVIDGVEALLLQDQHEGDRYLAGKLLKKLR